MIESTLTYINAYIFFQQVRLRKRRVLITGIMSIKWRWIRHEFQRLYNKILGNRTAETKNTLSRAETWQGTSPPALSRQRARANLDSGVASGESDYTTSHCGLSQYVSMWWHLQVAGGTPLDRRSLFIHRVIKCHRNNVAVRPRERREFTNHNGKTQRKKRKINNCFSHASVPTRRDMV